MKGLVKAGFAVAAVVCLLTPCVFAGAGTSSAEFLTIGIGARAIGMGGAFTGLADDVSAGYWNPGGMVQIKDTEVLTMYNAWLGGMSHIYLGLGKKLASGSVFGLQVNYVSSGDIPQSDINGNETGSFNASWMAAGLSYSGYLGEKTSVGVNLKNVTESIATESGSGFGADLGLLYSAGEKTKLGLAVQNAGTGISYAGDDSATAFPMVVRGGLSYVITNEEEKGFVMCTDISKANADKGMGFGLGGEYRTGNLALRFGAEQVGDGGMVPSLGIGINAGNFLIDVGGGMYQDLGSAYKVSLIGKFGGSGEVRVGRTEKPKETKASAVKSNGGNGGGLEAQLQKAIAAEDYTKAKELNVKIEQKKTLEAEMNQAIAAEDYTKAKELKAQIEELEK